MPRFSEFTQLREIIKKYTQMKMKSDLEERVHGFRRTNGAKNTVPSSNVFPIMYSGPEPPYLSL